MLRSRIQKSLAATLLGCSMSLSLFTGCVEEATQPVDDEVVLSGGATTIINATSNAFSTPAPNLSADRLGLHLRGDADFEAEFVAAPAEINSGLGPVFNNNACVSCHVRDGRGRPPFPGTAASQMLMRISMPGRDAATGGPVPVPGYGTQLFDKSIFGKTPQGRFSLDWVELPERYSDGTPYSLRRPIYAIVDAYRSMPGGVLLSPRIASPVFGLGLLEAVSESTIIEFADPNDGDGDGISGRPNYVWNVEKGERELGRFGWKANTPTLLQQTAAAYRNDMGITSPYFPVESSFGTDQHDGGDDEPEISRETLEAVTFYVQTLAVPARRSTGNVQVQRGEQLFTEINCASCHRPSMMTGTHPTVPEVSGQRIYPYTDMLLHDMGDGLSDNREDFEASGREWRTPPLWGIGLTSLVNGHTFFLHDGRARSIEEAILWHGGEAEGSREKFQTMSKEDRDALLAFVKSL